MQVTQPMCSIIQVDSFVSKKGTRCGVLRWFDQMEGKVYRTMVFGDDVAKLDGLGVGMACSVGLNIVPSRRDDTAEVYLAFVAGPESA